MSTDASPLPDPALLPDDPAVLKQLVVQLMEELKKERDACERLEHHIHLLLKRLYGTTSEKFDPRQGVLFDAQAGEGEAAASLPVPPVPPDRRSPGRQASARGSRWSRPRREARAAGPTGRQAPAPRCRGNRLVWCVGNSYVIFCIAALVQFSQGAYLWKMLPCRST